MREEDIVSAARTVRSELHSLLGEDSVAVGRRLDDLLDRAGRHEDTADDILLLLAADDRTRRRLQMLLPDEPDNVRSAYQGLPGYGDPSAEIAYGCQVCGYEYPIFEAGESPPAECPNGHGRLARVR